MKNTIWLPVVLLCVIAVLLLCVIGGFSQGRQLVASVSLGKDTVEVQLKKQDMELLDKVIEPYFQAYFSQDKAALQSLVAERVIWYLHIGESDFRGKKIVGRTEYIDTIRLRFENWKNLQFKDSRIDIFSNGQGFVHRYILQGMDENSGPIHIQAVDIFTVENEKIVERDSYWKFRRMALDLNLGIDTI